MSPSDDEIARTLDALARDRAPKTFCPSEAARALAANWRPLMPKIRRVARDMGLVATQRGRAVDPVAASGPIRLARAEEDDAP